MTTDDARSMLATILRRAAPDIVVLVAQEAARSSGATMRERETYEQFLSAAAAPILDVVTESDAARAQVFSTALPGVVLHGAPVVPPVARVGLLEIGLRLARAEIAREATTDAHRADLERELVVLGDQLRVAVAAMCGGVPAA